jgi:hypothetical protein
VNIQITVFRKEVLVYDITVHQMILIMRKLLGFEKNREEVSDATLTLLF